MSWLRRSLPSLLLVVPLLAATSAAMAQRASRVLPEVVLRAQAAEPARGRDEGRRRHDAHDALSDSVRRIERSTRGQVLSAERVPFDGRNVNRIKVVDDRGRVRVYMDDPESDSDRRGPPTRDDDD